MPEHHKEDYLNIFTSEELNQMKKTRKQITETLELPIWEIKDKELTMTIMDKIMGKKYYCKKHKINVKFRNHNNICNVKNLIKIK